MIRSNVFFRSSVVTTLRMKRLGICCCIWTIFLFTLVWKLLLICSFSVLFQQIFLNCPLDLFCKMEFLCFGFHLCSFFFLCLCVIFLSSQLEHGVHDKKKRQIECMKTKGRSKCYAEIQTITRKEKKGGL